MPFVYWIHHKNHVDIYTEGYVGITVDVNKRFNEHKNCSKKSKKYIVHSAIEKYKDDIRYTVICECDYDYAVFLENKLRPLPLIGWNIICGGNKGRLGLPQSENQKKLVKKALEGRFVSEKSIQSASNSNKKRVRTKSELEKRSKAVLNKNLLDLCTTNLDVLSRINDIYYCFLKGKKQYATSKELNIPYRGMKAIFNRFEKGYNPLIDFRVQDFVSEYQIKYGLYTTGNETDLKVNPKKLLHKGIFFNDNEIICYVYLNKKKISKNISINRFGFGFALMDCYRFLKEIYVNNNKLEELSELNKFMQIQERR